MVRFSQGVKAVLTSAAIGLALAGPMVSLPGSAGASDKRAVGEISASGLVFKVSDLPKQRKCRRVLHNIFALRFLVYSKCRHSTTVTSGNDPRFGGFFCLTDLL